LVIDAQDHKDFEDAINEAGSGTWIVLGDVARR
jgi:hypothetical protein